MKTKDGMHEVLLFNSNSKEVLPIPEKGKVLQDWWWCPIFSSSYEGRTHVSYVRCNEKSPMDVHKRDRPVSFLLKGNSGFTRPEDLGNLYIYTTRLEVTFTPMKLVYNPAQIIQVRNGSIRWEEDTNDPVLVPNEELRQQLVIEFRTGYDNI